MKKQLIYICLLFFITVTQNRLYANEPDSAYLFAYSSGKNNHHNGLHFAWSLDKRNGIVSALRPVFCVQIMDNGAHRRK